MNGWIKLHRKLLVNPICTSQDHYLLQLWIHILLSVNHENKRFLWNGKEIVIKAGQGIFGLNKITEALTGKTKKYGKFAKYKTIYYRKLKILENLQNVKLQKTNKFTIITVLNWHRYQEMKLKRNSSETQVKTNKKDKNEKKEYTYGQKFLEFWEVYPRKNNKHKASLVWEKIKPNASLARSIVASVEKYKQTKDWLKDDGQFIPHATTYLNGRMWEDEIKIKESEEDKLWKEN